MRRTRARGTILWVKKNAKHTARGLYRLAGGDLFWKFDDGIVTQDGEIHRRKGSCSLDEGGQRFSLSWS